MFDLDGCLVDSMTGTVLRPSARELLEALRDAGVEIRIWSAGGAQYAETVAARVGVADLIVAFHSKDRRPNGKWALPCGLDAVDLVCVDDQPDGVPEDVPTEQVFPFISGQPGDRYLARLLDRFRSDPISFSSTRTIESRV